MKLLTLTFVTLLLSNLNQVNAKVDSKFCSIYSKPKDVSTSVELGWFGEGLKKRYIPLATKLAGLTEKSIQLLNKKGYRLVETREEASIELNFKTVCKEYIGSSNDGGRTYRNYCGEIHAFVTVTNIKDATDSIQLEGVSDPWMLFEASAEKATMRALEQLFDCALE